MKYKMMADECFTDKLDGTIKYKPGDKIKTKITESRKEDLITRKLAHVVKEIDTTDKDKKKKADEEAAKKKAEEEAKKLAEEEEAKKKADEEAAKKKASENPTDEK